MELPYEIQMQVDQLFEQNEVCYEKGDYDQCIALHKQAWSLFPEPKIEYEAEGYSLIEGLVDLLLTQNYKIEAEQWIKVLRQFSCSDSGKTDGAAVMEETIYDQIEELSEQGNVLAAAAAYSGAIQKFTAALVLLPEPKMNWEAATWLYASIGDMYYWQEDYPAAREHLYNALNGPDGQQNAFIHLRLGQALRRLHEQDKALEHLLRAYMLEGGDIFKEEKDDFKFLSANVRGIK